MYREVDVVLVMGELVTATATNEYADLFRALKGGANRFGIVTRYEVEAVHTGTKDDKRWFGGMIIVSHLHLTTSGHSLYLYSTQNRLKKPLLMPSRTTSRPSKTPKPVCIPSLRTPFLTQSLF